MSKMEYMPVDCLQVPKMLFQVEEFKNLSNTAKILYSLFLDRLKFAVQNGWVDHNGDLFVIYPKSEMKKDLNTTRYGVDQAVQELVKIGKLVRIVQNDGKANHFYINDIFRSLYVLLWNNYLHYSRIFACRMYLLSYKETYKLERRFNFCRRVSYYCLAVFAYHVYKLYEVGHYKASVCYHAVFFRERAFK